MDPLRVIICGHVTHDRFAERMVAGGCAYYGARAYQGLGAEVVVRTTVGLDFSCEHELAGVELDITRAGSTTLFTNLYPDDGPRLQLIEAIAPEVVPTAALGARGTVDILHLAPVLHELDIGRWRRGLEARIVALNVQGFTRVAGALVAGHARPPGVGRDARHVDRAPWDVTAAELEGIDVAFVSNEDLEGQGDLLERLLQHIPVVAFTHGRDGAEVLAKGRRVRVGIYPSEPGAVVDPTGAGDGFAAGFTFALARGESIERAGQLGAAAASIVIEAEGGAALARLGQAFERAAAVSVVQETRT